VPSSLLNAAFTLPGQVEGLRLPQVLRTVTINPARAAGCVPAWKQDRAKEILLQRGKNRPRNLNEQLAGCRML